MQSRVREFREHRGWSQGELAERLEVSRQTVNAIETRPVRLTGAQGHTVKCLSGTAWITAVGAAHDVFLRPGQVWIVPNDGLVLAEAMACGTPVAALDRGAVREVVENGVTGRIFDDLDAMLTGLDSVLALDRRRVHDAAVQRFGVMRMVDGYVDAFRAILAQRQGR